MKKVNLPTETVEKLIKNEFEMNEGNIEETVGNEVEETEELEVTELPELPEVEETEELEVTELPELPEVEETEETEVVDYNEVDYEGRGFKSLDDAILFMETPYFKGLGEADKNEYRNWLIKK